MNYHEIRTDDMLNGDGLRVTLFVSGCEHQCDECHNPQTWNKDNGMLFDNNTSKELMEKLAPNYISGLTLSGGDPLYDNETMNTLFMLCENIQNQFPDKTIWIYSGYTWEEIFPTIVTDNLDVERELRERLVSICDVFVDGKYKKELSDVKYHWAGSTNQRVIDIKKSLEKGEIILHE